VTAEGLGLGRGLLELAMAPTGVGFVVKTPHADVIVRGTVFQVEVGQATRVSVTSGAVAVESRVSGHSIMMGAGDKVSVLPSGRVQTSLVTAVEPPVADAATGNAAGQSEDTRLGTSDEN